MPLLGALLTSLFGGAAGMFAGSMAKKVATAGAAIAGLAVVTGVLIAAFNTAVAPLAQQVFDTQYGQLLGLVFPPISGTCIAVFIGTWAGCVLYRWQLNAINLGAMA